jgi:phosphate transport system substrate-binding protein
VKKTTKENPLRSRTWLALCAAAVLAFGVAACGSSNNSSSSSSSSGSSSSGSSSSSGGTVNGAGSTFAAPIYSQWGNALKGKGITVNYQPVGSGAGIAQLAAGTADFGASDPALKPADRATFKKGTVQQIPMALGAITISYNLSGVKKGLKLDGKTAADIFQGKITKWNDPAIAKLNPGVSLPSDSITVVHRSDASGTTAGFTKFLSAYSPEWASKVGSDKTVKWPVGTGAKGNDGVAAAVKQQKGAVGYVEEAFALQNNFTTASVKNKSGKFVEPTLASTTAAGQGVKIPADLGVSVIDSPNPTAYPISSQTFVVVYKDLCKGGLSQGTAKAVKGFIDYGLGQGQSVLGQLQYAQLPAPLLSKSKAAASSLTCNGSPVTG